MLFIRILAIIGWSFLMPCLLQAQESLNKEEIRQYKLSALQSQYEGDKNTAGHYLNRIAFVYWEKKDLTKAAHYFEQSIRLSTATGNEATTAMLASNLASIYREAGKYQKAIQYLEKTIQIHIQSRQKEKVAQGLFNLGNVYQETKNYKKAVEIYEKGLRVAQVVHKEMLISAYYEALAESYEKLKKPSKSAKYYKLYAHSARATPNYGMHSYDKAKVEEAELWIRTMEEEKRKQEEELAAALDEVRSISEQKGEIELLREEQAHKIKALEKDKLVKELALKEHALKLENNRIITYAVAIGGTLAILLVGVLWVAYQSGQQSRRQLEIRNVEILRQNKEIESRKYELQGVLDVLENKNLKITASINYAKRIQDATLPKEVDFKKALPDSFVLYKPRDVVSGDFYWITEKDFRPVFTSKWVNGEEISILKGFESEKVIFTAVDCTGHGVPGAFMSMIGVNLLNEIVTVRNLSEPDKILNELHKSIRKALQQKKTANRDGMDMAICCHDKKNNLLEYAGAKNPLICIQDDELKIVRADRKTIGGLQREKQRIFQKQTLSLETPIMAYIFSDGYQDQFGGPQGKKFTQKRLRTTFQEIHKYSLEKQHDMLVQTLKEWQGKEEQIDDILVLGFHLG